MIFKTIPSDINKSGKAFEFLGKKVSDLKAAFDNAGGGIKGFRSALTELTKKDFKLNTAGEIITKDNIDSFIPILSDKRADKLAKSIIKINKNKSSWNDFNNKLTSDEKEYIPNLIKNTEDLSKVTGEDLVKANKEARQSILDHNEALQQTTLSSRVASAGMGILKTALNSIAFMAITQAVITLANTIITKFDDIVNAYQNGIDKLKDLSGEIKGLESEQSSLNSELKESQERLYELQQIKMPNLFEQAEIENIKEYNKQLEMQIRLLELELELKRQEANKTAQDTFKNSQIDYNPFDDAFTKDFEWWEHILNTLTVNNWANLKNSFGNISNWFQGNTWDQQMAYLKDAEFWLEKYQEVVEYAKTVDDENVYNNLLVNQDYKKGKLDGYINDLSKRYQEWNTELLGLDPYDKANEERIKQLQDAMARAEKVLHYEDPVFKNIEDLFNSPDYSDIVVKLEALAKAGNLTEKTFNNVAGIERFKEALANTGETGLTVEEAIEALNDKTQKETKKSAEGINNLSEAFKKLYDAIDDVLSKQEKLADAFKKTMLGGTLTIKELYELIKEMPSLAQYASKEGDGYTISAEGFEAVSKENDNAVKELIAKDLESARNDIAILEKEKELRAEKDRLYQQWENTGGANKNLKNQYDEVAAEYEEVASQCQNIENSIEDLKESEESLILLNDLVSESFNESKLSIEGLNEAYDNFKNEISGYNSNIQTIDNALKKLKESSLLTYDEMNSLVDISPELQDSFEEQENGYNIAIDALEELREQSCKTRNDYIDDTIAKTEAEIEAAEKSKETYLAIINEFRNRGATSYLANSEYIESLEGDIKDTDQLLQNLYDTINKLEGLKGGITSEAQKEDDLSDKLQNQIDYYKTILSAVEAVQNKYSEAIDREIDALTDSKSALRDANDERQRELDLIDARNNLENAKKRKVWVYSEGEGFKQVVDEKAVKEAEEDYRNVVVDIQEAEIDKKIDFLTDQKEQIEENTQALIDLESEIEEAKTIAQAVNVLGLSDESELLTLPDETVEEIKNGLTEATLQKDIEDNKGNDEYIPVSMDEILQRMGATVTAEDFYKSISGAENQREMYNIGTKQYADALNGQMNGSIINNGGTNVTNYNTFQIYDATDPDKVARVVNREMTNLFTKIGNSIK